MRDCPECGSPMYKEQAPKFFRGRMLYESRWICSVCDYWEEDEPDPDSMKGGKDHE